MNKDLICIGCPLGCAVTVEMDGDIIVSVTGNTCPRGDAYARKEVTSPTRIVTSTVRVNGGTLPVVSVKTQNDIPKNKMIDCVKALRKVVLEAPVRIGDVALSDVVGLSLIHI